MITFKAKEDIKKGEWLVIINEKVVVTGEISFNEDIGVEVIEQKEEVYNKYTKLKAKK